MLGSDNRMDYSVWGNRGMVFRRLEAMLFYVWICGRWEIVDLQNGKAVLYC